jgi:hypothetical protein
MGTIAAAQECRLRLMESGKNCWSSALVWSIPPTYRSFECDRFCPCAFCERGVNEQIRPAAILACTRTKPGVAPQRQVAAATLTNSLPRTRSRPSRSVIGPADRADCSADTENFHHRISANSRSVIETSSKQFVLRLVRSQPRLSCDWASVQLSSRHSQKREEQPFSQNRVGNLYV